MTFPERYRDFEFNLLPCPFCGGRPHITDMGYPHWIYCESCGAQVHGRMIGEVEGVIASVNIWNARARYETVIRTPEEVR